MRGSQQDHGSTAGRGGFICEYHSTYSIEAADRARGWSGRPVQPQSRQRQAITDGAAGLRGGTVCSMSSSRGGEARKGSWFRPKTLLAWSERCWLDAQNYGGASAGTPGDHELTWYKRRPQRSWRPRGHGWHWAALGRPRTHDAPDAHGRRDLRPVMQGSTARGGSLARPLGCVTAVLVVVGKTPQNLMLDTGGDAGSVDGDEVARRSRSSTHVRRRVKSHPASHPASHPNNHGNLMNPPGATTQATANCCYPWIRRAPRRASI